MRLCEIVSPSDTVVDRELETKEEVDGLSILVSGFSELRILKKDSSSETVVCRGAPGILDATVDGRLVVVSAKVDGR